VPSQPEKQILAARGFLFTAPSGCGLLQCVSPPSENAGPDRGRVESPLEEFRRRIAANDELIRRPELDNGRTLASARTQIFTDLTARWAAEQQRAFGYDRPFAVVALGGTGREELTPCSDLDFAFLFDDAVEGNPFLLELQRQTLHSDDFERAHGFSFLPLPFNLDDLPGLEGKQLNSFLDLRAVHDPDGLAPRFRKRIRETFDPFEHFLYVQGFWRTQWAQAASEPERLDRFDIKHDGLRVFLAGIWTRAGREFVHSHDIYRTLEDPRDLAAHDLLLRIRGFIHSRRPVPRRQASSGNHAEDVLGFDDFNAFGELLGPEAEEGARFEFAGAVRARLLSARRRVAQFTTGVMGHELRHGRGGRPGSPILYGEGGLWHAASAECQTPREKSRAALSLLLASQRYQVPIDRAELEGTFRNAGDWLVPVPELAALFYEQRGSLADSFAFVSRIDGAEERLFPGYAKFESSFDERVLTERRSLRSALEREKLRALEALLRDGQTTLSGPAPDATAGDPTHPMFAAVEAALLDPDHLAAVKLALKTKRLPVTPEDRILRDDTARPLHERFSTGFSGIPLAEYFGRCFAGCEFTSDTLDVARFLVANRRAFKEHAAAALNDGQRVREFQALCGDETRLRALFVFTCADRSVWEAEAQDPARWRNTRELYLKTRRQFHPELSPARPLGEAGFSREEAEILGDFGEDFFGGSYGRHAPRLGSHLLRLAREPGARPKVTLLREGASMILGVAARDYRGLAACISGTLWRLGIPVQQAHLFSAAVQGLALDFFHLARMEKPVGSEQLRAIEDAIQQRLHIGPEDEAALPSGAEHLSLTELRPGLHCLQAETSGDVGALIYWLAFLVFHRLGGNVFALAAHTSRTGPARVTAYHSLPPGLSIADAQAVLLRPF
jgi:Putative nucleotidyltransferase DUF294